MNQRIRKLWLKALRSGEYSQAQGFLHDEEGFCCLGVLCDQYAKETNNGHWERIEKENENLPTRYAFIIESDDGETSDQDLLPVTVADWAEVYQNPSVSFPDKYQTETLSHMNDSGADFEQIADAIEKGKVE